MNSPRKPRARTSYELCSSCLPQLWCLGHVRCSAGHHSLQPWPRCVALVDRRLGPGRRLISHDRHRNPVAAPACRASRGRAAPQRSVEHRSVHHGFKVPASVQRARKRLAGFVSDTGSVASPGTRTGGPCRNEEECRTWSTAVAWFSTSPC